MTTSQVLVTALPHDLDPAAPFHLTAFVTHKLVPTARDATVADFPAVADWIATLTSGTWQLVTDATADPLPLEMVPDPMAPADAVAWAACVPPSTPVSGYPAPVVSTAAWNSYPAHRLSDHALDLHLMTLTAAPTGRPGVLANPVLNGIIDRLARQSDHLQLIRQMAEEREGRADRVLARRTADAQVSLGQPERRGRPYDLEVDQTRSALEHLFDDEGLDDRVTGALDAELGRDLRDDPELRLMVDAHATRRFYDRPEEQSDYRAVPEEGATTARPDVPEQDFHARIGSFGSVPALMRRLGLVVRLRLADAAAASLANATWVAVRFQPAAGVDLVRLAPPRTRVTVSGTRFQAVASEAWVDGALPLGEPGYVLLDLDPDASGLKLDQHLRGLPRIMASEVNGDAATSAPATLRSTGFAIARTDRIAATRQRVQRAETLPTEDDGPGVTGPELLYDDLVRGLRMDVWDDRSRGWHSLHERLVSVTVASEDGGAVVLDGVEDSGFLQLSGLNRVPGPSTNPYYLHEVVAGWDGWSLAAPRPGKVIVHGPDGQEGTHDVPPDDPASDVHVSTRVRPGSLPRLRWGTSYAFRILGVDLAGDVVAIQPHRAEPGQRPDRASVEAARTHLDRLRQQYADRDERGLLRAVRNRVLDALPGDDGSDAGKEPGPWGVHAAGAPAGDGAGAPGAPPTWAAPIEPEVPDFVRTGNRAIDDAVAERLAAGAARAANLSGAAADLHQAARATRVLAESARAWRVRPQLALQPEALAKLLGPRAPGRPVVTLPRPYLRWSPVPPPTLVAQSDLTTGEQLSRLVIRSGLPEGGPDATSTSTRHVVPPKTTQLEAETAGMFDTAIGSTDATAQRTAYAIALAERGTLLDQEIPSLADANATRTQPGIRLLSRPGADPSTAVTLPDITAKRDTPLGEGQYVVHGADDLTLPYLPDPHAAGIALVFYDAGAPHLMTEPRALQAVVLAFPGDWPQVEPLRVVLEAGSELGARLDGRAVRVTLPPGEQVRVALSSSVRTKDLEAFGLWRSHLASTIDPDGDGGASQDDVVAAAVLVRAAASGWTWWLTPSVDVRLVHAVPAPVRAPRLLGLTCSHRPPALTSAQLAGLAEVHGASTDRLVVRASWSEWVDDLAAAAPQRVQRSQVVVDSPVGGTERWGLLWMIDFQPFGASATARTLADGDIGLHRAIVSFPDTHRRTLTCTPSGVTRYAEFFAPADIPDPQDPSHAGDPVQVEVPSSARPSAPDVAETVPLLRWEAETEPEQPFALRRVRRSGVRIWLRRPWFSSGDGELLGVVLSGAGGEPADSISLWGRDPIYQGAPVKAGAQPPLLEPVHLLLQALGGQSARRAARPVLAPTPVPLVDLAGPPTAVVFGYEPEYHEERGMWFVDVALDDTPVLWPFVRLAVARFQPTSIAGATLSPVVLTSWVQPLPTRTCTVSRPDADHVRVTLTGTVALLRAPRLNPIDDPGDELGADTPTGDLRRIDALLAASRTVEARLEMLPDGATDLQWQVQGVRRLRLVGIGDETNFRATWGGELAIPHGLGQPADLRTPGSSTRWRVVVEESELLDADAPEVANVEGRTVTTARVVYADVIPL